MSWKIWGFELEHLINMTCYICIMYKYYAGSLSPSLIDLKWDLTLIWWLSPRAATSLKVSYLWVICMQSVFPNLYSWIHIQKMQIGMILPYLVWSEFSVESTYSKLCELWFVSGCNSLSSVYSGTLSIKQHSAQLCFVDWILFLISYTQCGWSD